MRRRGRGWKRVLSFEGGLEGADGEDGGEDGGGGGGGWDTAGAMVLGGVGL